jgi:hypothetical protein
MWSVFGKDVNNFVFKNGQIMSLSFQMIGFVNKVRFFVFYGFRKQLDPKWLLYFVFILLKTIGSEERLHIQRHIDHTSM